MPNSAGVEVARISVKVSPDTKQFRRDLKSDLDAIEKSIQAKVDVEPDMTGFRRQVAATTKGMRATVKVDADVDNAGFFGRIAESMASIKGPEFGRGLSGILLNPAGLAASVGLLAALSPLIAGTLGALTTGLVALPGLITAVAVPIGALTLGMDGFKRASERLRQPFEDLKTLMSTRVEEQFTPFFAQLEQVFPSLAKTLPSVTQGMADMAKSFADVLTNPENLGKLESTINNIADGLKEAAPGIGDFTQGLLDLINGFSGKLPDLGKWFSDTGASFSKWVTDFTTVGPDGTSKFDRALTGLGDTLKIIGDALVDVGKGALEFFSDPEKIKTFKDELVAVAGAVKAIADGINGIATAYSKLPLAGEGPLGLMPIQLQLIKDALSGINFSGIWDGLTSGATAAFGIVVASAGTFVSSVVGKITSIGSALTGIWSGITAAAQAAWSSLVTAVQGAVASVVSIVSQLPGQIIAIFTSLAGTLTGIGTSLMQGLANGISAGVGLVRAAVQGLANLIPDWAKKILGIASPSKVFHQIGEFTGQGFVDGLTSQKAALAEASKGLAATVTDEFKSGLDLKFGSDGFSTGSDDPFMKAAAGLMNIPVDFAKATGGQFMSDLGISGEGMISKAITEGANYVFQIGSVDEALSIKDREESKQARTFTGR